MNRLRILLSKLNQRLFLLSVILGINFVQAEIRAHWMRQDISRIPNIEVTAMAMDDQGNKWFGTKGGLARLSAYGAAWTTYTVESTQGAIKNNVINAIVIDEYRDVWVATESGVSYFSGGNWKTFTVQNTNNGLPDNFITSIALGKDHEKWFGTKNGFAELRGNIWTTYSGEKISGRLPNKVVTAIAVENNGDKWIGTLAGLVRFNGAIWKTHTKESTEEGLPHNSIVSIALLPNGDKWIATANGITKLSNLNGEIKKSSWTSFKDNSQLGDLASEQIYSLTTSFGSNKTGDVWVCSKGGAALYKNGDWTLFTKANTSGGIPTKFVYAAMSGPNGEAWFGTHEGIVSLSYIDEED